MRNIWQLTLQIKLGAYQKWEPAGRIGDFEIIFWAASLKAHAYFDRPEY